MDNGNNDYIYKSWHSFRVAFSVFQSTDAIGLTLEVPVSDVERCWDLSFAMLPCHQIFVCVLKKIFSKNTTVSWRITLNSRENTSSKLLKDRSVLEILWRSRKEESQRERGRNVCCDVTACNKGLWMCVCLSCVKFEVSPCLILFPRFFKIN